MTGNSAMDDGSRCLLDVIGDPSALQSFLEEGESFKNSPSVSLDDSPLQVDFSIRTNGTHFRASPTLLKQAAAAAAAAGSLGPFQVSSTQTASSGVSTQVVCSTQAPSPAYHQPVASPQIGQSPLGSHNATAAVQSPSPTPFSVPSRSPAQPIPCPSPIHAPPPPSQSPASIYQSKSPVQAPSPLPHYAPPSKSPGAGVVLPQPSPSPTTPIASPQQAILQQPAVAQALSLASASGPVVQFVSATPPMVSGRNMKPIQPKQPHLLPKPSGATNGMQFGNAVGKQTNHRNHPVSVAPSPQTNQLVIGQSQPSATMLPNANVAVAGGSGSALLFNHISLGLAQNQPILIQGNAGGIQNLQLVMRPQQPGATLTTSGQPTGHGAAGNTNTAALLAAYQVQNQAAHQALINQSKGQTVVIPTSTNLFVPQGNPLGKQNVIVNSTRMVNPGQGLQLQQIQTPQGPITLAITPQQLRGLQTVGGANLTLATAGAPAGTVLQGVTISQAQIQGTAGLQTGVVVNRQTIPASTVPPTDNRQNAAQAQQVKAPSVNLEELLKQAGIVPADPRQTPLITTQPQVVSQPQQTVLLNSTGLPVTRSNNSQLLAQLQQSISLAQAPQAQMKLSIAQDGSVFLQRPVVTPTQTAGPTNATTQDSQPSVLMQRLNAGTTHHQIQIPTTSSMDSNPTLLPLTVQNINLSSTPQTALLTIGATATTTATTVMPSMTTTGGNGGVVTTTVSGLMQANPTLVQSLTQGTPAQLNVPTSNTVAVSTTTTQQQQTNAILTQNILNQLTTSCQSSFGNTITSTLSNGAGMVKSEVTPVVLSAGTPITAIPPGQKLQTIQLSLQNQENLQKIHTQLRNLSALKAPTSQQRQLIQQLQANQQKILAQGKVVQIQQTPGNTIQLIQQQPASTVVPSVVGTTKNNANVHLSNLLKQAPANARTISTPTTTTTTTTTTKTSTVTTATVTVPTQIKLGNQVVTLTPQQRQTFQQIQQQLKTLGPEQQQLYLAQNKQAVIVKLQQQQQNQQNQQQTNSTISTSIANSGQATTITPAQPAIAVASNAGGLLVIQTFGKGIAQVKSIVPAIVQDQQSRGIKRPAPTPVTQGSPLQQQLASDQNGALKPDCRTPFRSVKDACRRLLKYHVFNSKTPSQQDLENADKQFEVLSEQLLQKARRVISTYHHLLLQESMRKHPSAELLMLNKLFVEDEKKSLENDKKEVEEGKELNLPPLPEHWRHKMDAVSDEDKISVSTSLAACSANCSSSSNLASTSATTVVTTVHTAPLLSPNLVEAKPRLVNKSTSNSVSDAHKSSDGNYDEWAEIQKELEMYPLDGDNASSTGNAVGSASKNKGGGDDEVMMTTGDDDDWSEMYVQSRDRLSESEAAVESILLDGPPTPLRRATTTTATTEVELTDMDEFEDDEDETEGASDDVEMVGRVAPHDDLNAQVESAINSILHLQQDNEGFEYMDGEYGLMDEEEGIVDESDVRVKEEKRGIVVEDNGDHVTMEYDAVSLDTPEMDAALEEAVKSIM